MERRRELSLDERAKIIAFQKAGYSYRSISAEIGCSISTVCYTIKKHRDTGEIANKAGRGRKRILTHADERWLFLASLRNRHKNAEFLTAEFNRGRKDPISKSTVRAVLKKFHLKGRVAAKKPFLRPINIKKRLKFAKEHEHWTVEDWTKVLFTDESKFELFGTNRRAYVRRRSHEKYKAPCILPTVKHGGGSVMVWGAVSANGVGPLKLIEGIMDKKMYVYVARFGI